MVPKIHDGLLKIEGHPRVRGDRPQGFIDPMIKRDPLAAVFLFEGELLLAMDINSLRPFGFGRTFEATDHVVHIALEFLQGPEKIDPQTPKEVAHEGRKRLALGGFGINQSRIR
jgi:hypothetical protein